MIKSMKPRQMAEDMANMIIEDLEEEGFKAKLVKKGWAPSKWKIEPVDDLNEDQLQDFNYIKDKRQELYKQRTMDQIKQMRKSI
jgi:hypothetical protein